MVVKVLSEAPSFTGLAGSGRAAAVGPTGEQPGSAVVFGFDLVVDEAQRSFVVEGGLAAVGDRVDVIVLKMAAPVAFRRGAAVAVELRRRAELEGGTEDGRNVAAEVGDRIDLHSVVKHRLEERILAQFTDGRLAGVSRITPVAFRQATMR